MATEIYLDLIENPVKNWISLFCETNIFDCLEDKYCLLFSETIDNKKKCIMLYVDVAYPPFDNIEFKIKDNKYMDILIKELYGRIKMFYLSTSKMLLEGDKQSKLKILENTDLAIDICTYTLLPYPIDVNYINNNKKLYDNEEVTQEILKSEDAKKIDDINLYYRKVFNGYANYKHRIGINVEILDIPPPKGIKKDLLSNYQNLSDSSDSSDNS